MTAQVASSTLTVTMDIALIVAIMSIITTIVAVVMFFSRLKWSNDLLAARADKQESDTNKLGERMTSLKELHATEQYQVLARIESVDKAVGQLAEGLAYVKETLKEIKDRACV